MSFFMLMMVTLLAMLPRRKEVTPMKTDHCQKIDSRTEDSYLEEDKDNIIFGPGVREIPIEYVITKEIEKTEICGETLLTYRDKNGRERTFPKRCQKLYCKKCGGRDNYIHNKRLHRFRDKYGYQKTHNIQRYIFTIPHELIETIKDRDNLNKLLRQINRIISTIHGDNTGIRRRERKTENVFRLHKKTLVTVELLGNNGSFNPHINVLIFNEDNSNLTLPKDTLHDIKEKYKKALTRISGMKPDVVDVQYKFYPDL